MYGSRVAGTPSGAKPAPGRRSYESGYRRQQADLTRSAILDSARRLFTEKGWAGTGMRDIAREAGVAVETVYASVGSKVAVLLAALEAAAAVEDPTVPLTERPEIRILKDGAFAQRAATGAGLAASGNARTVGLHKAFREGAASDPALAEPFAEYLARRRTDFGQVVQLVAQRPLDQHEQDGLWAVLSRDVYELLVERSGWSQQEYQQWAEAMIVRVLGQGRATKARPKQQEKGTNEGPQSRNRSDRNRGRSRE